MLIGTSRSPHVNKIDYSRPAPLFKKLFLTLTLTLTLLVLSLNHDKLSVPITIITILGRAYIWTRFPLFDKTVCLGIWGWGLRFCTGGYLDGLYNRNFPKISTNSSDQKREGKKSTTKKSITEKIYNDFIIQEKLYSVSLTHLLGIGIGIEKKSLKAEDST